ncbi:hypothetical protein [Streptoalloteichus hindustanus]|nr:hypothetical protein [Streptoalloteichus hindustanus]
MPNTPALIKAFLRLCKDFAYGVHAGHAIRHGIKPGRPRESEAEARDDRPAPTLSVVDSDEAFRKPRRLPAMRPAVRRTPC